MSMEQHIIRTMMTETVDSNVRMACARALLRHENGYIRSVAYWFRRNGRISDMNKRWWALVR